MLLFLSALALPTMRNLSPEAMTRHVTIPPSLLFPASWPISFLFTLLGPLTFRIQSCLSMVESDFLLIHFSEKFSQFVLLLLFQVMPRISRFKTEFHEESFYLRVSSEQKLILGAILTAGGKLDNVILEYVTLFRNLLSCPQCFGYFLLTLHVDMS